MKNPFKEYFRNRSKWSIAGDALFAALLGLMIIPGPRNVIMSNVIRLISTQPSKLTSTPLTLSAADYNWSFRDGDGKVTTFADLKGKVVFLNHWATWCPHCVAEMPSIKKLYDDYGDKVVFILLTSEEPSVVEPFLEKRELKIPYQVPLSPVPQMLNTRSLPRTYIIGADGRIYLDKTGAAKWDGNRTRELLDELLAAER